MEKCGEKTAKFIEDTLIQLYEDPKFKVWIYFNTCISFLFLQRPTNSQLFHKWSHSSYMFQHYSLILRKLAKLHKYFKCSCW